VKTADFSKFRFEKLPNVKFEKSPNFKFKTLPNFRFKNLLNFIFEKSHNRQKHLPSRTLWLAFDFLQKQKHLKNPTKHTLADCF
jgi:hypothetical protein